MDINKQIENIKNIIPGLTILTKPINSPGNYLFFSHISFEEGQPRYHFSIYMARKVLRTDLSDIMQVIYPLMDAAQKAGSALLKLESMKPIQLEGLFVTYQLDLSVSELYQREEAWLT